MKYLIVFYIGLCPILSHAQIVSSIKCNPRNWTFFYFAFQAKYQVSSESLVIKANEALIDSPNSINGSITVRFMVNCEGEKGNYQVLALDKNYVQTQFDKAITDKILAFTKETNLWKKSMYKNLPIDYYTFMNYRFTDGKITEIIP
jgi:hypothetical protein